MQTTHDPLSIHGQLLLSIACTYRRKSAILSRASNLRLAYKSRRVSLLLVGHRAFPDGFCNTEGRDHPSTDKRIVPIALAGDAKLQVRLNCGRLIQERLIAKRGIILQVCGKDSAPNEIASIIVLQQQLMGVALPLQEVVLLD